MMPNAPQDRFPPPWTAVEVEGGWKVLDAAGKPLGYFYGRDGSTDRTVYPLTRDQARRLAVGFARLPALIEGETIAADNRENAWAALRMIREAVETLGPPGSLPSEEAVLALYGPEPVHEAQAIVAALRKLLSGAA